MATYARFVYTYIDEKKEKNKTRLTTGRNLITDYECGVITDTTGLKRIKLHWCLVLSTEYTKYMTMNIGIFYLNITPYRYKYTMVKINTISQEVIDVYKLYDLSYVHNNFLFIEI